MRRITLTGSAGMKIRAGDGTEEPSHSEMMSTPLFYTAHPGDRLRLLDDGYLFNVATYAPDIDPKWIYTYSYAPDQSWTVYRQDLSGKSYRKEDYVFDGHVYFRVCLRKVSGDSFDGSEDINLILAFEAESVESYHPKSWILSEADRVAERVRSIRKEGWLAFALLTDTHYTVNGTWADTAKSIKLVHGMTGGFDGVIHLGDLTDGMVTSEATRFYVNKMMGDLKSIGSVWVALGNHDSNYFRDNPERLTIEQQSGLYLDGKPPRYYVDFYECKLRLVFLDSFDPGENPRYGYSCECISWFSELLESTLRGWKVIVLSHLPPCARLQYWSKSIRGENELTHLLQLHAEKIIAFINGHNHADRLDNCEGFPILSIANAKCEAFTEYKSDGFVTPERRLGEASQELWDVMLVNPNGMEIYFVRFGAGADRAVINGRAEWF